MKRSQTKFHAHNMRELLGQKKSKFIVRSKIIVRSKFSSIKVFLLIDTLLKLQQQILICSCKFSCSSVVTVGLLRLLA